MVFVGPRKIREKKRGTLRVASTRTLSAEGKATEISPPGESAELATLSFEAKARALASERVRMAASDQLPSKKAEAPASAPASVDRWSS
jgi:hypothetical protein